MRDLLTIFNDFKDGDSNAFMELIENKYIRSIINTATINTPHLERDEIINEIYIMINNRKDNLNFKTPQQITTYLKQSIYGLLQNSSEKNASKILQECEYGEALQNTIPFYDESYELLELLEDKTYLRERILEEKTYNQIASDNNVSLSSVYRTIKKDQAQLKHILNR